MRNVQLNINLPDLTNFGETHLKTLLAAKLYEHQDLSLGQAAVVAGLPKRVFAEMLGTYEVSLFSQNIDEINDDIKNA